MAGSLPCCNAMTISDNFPTSNEFRSDTFTVPTQSMLQAIAYCTVGDSVYKEDQDTLDLEAKVAQLAGKEAGLFCCSGTMSNQIGLRAHLHQPPHRILCDYRGHVYAHEAGGLATLSQAMVTPVIPSNGNYLTLDDILDNYIPDDGDIHMAPTKVISLENTLHGTIMPLDTIKEISGWCRANGVRLHLDGARLWNASVETGISIAEYCQYFDSVSLCLSKGLGAPVGSILVGERKFIEKANHFKKQNGGGIRQAGMLTKMASIAIDENLEKLLVGHKFAKQVAQFCEQNGIALESPCQTNFVFLDPKKVKIDPAVLAELAVKYKVKVMGYRFAFHFQNSPDAVERLQLLLKEAYQHSLAHPYISKGAVRIYRSAETATAK
ncbi:hypothetical protein OGAPHI_001218 [Ogataea philodendri]|uniref:low-specificity L-threonine aldolase n=1 Tax=Ogataea philodendri TaxID=1378263 RepID=A0A9P8PEB9_9ASCO|nr:uncharacterized protein OGAPHI_001218 [Ogataea philodendri]KAH3670703.1 hypothetical protein OGAPHI_001218 [Ogataea philodendri]